MSNFPCSFKAIVSGAAIAAYEVFGEDGGGRDYGSAAKAGLTYAGATYLGDYAVMTLGMGNSEPTMNMLTEAAAAGLVAGGASQTQMFAPWYHNQSMQTVAVKAAAGSLVGAAAAGEMVMAGSCPTAGLGGMLNLNSYFSTGAK